MRRRTSVWNFGMRVVFQLFRHFESFDGLVYLDIRHVKIGYFDIKSDIQLWALDMESILKFDATNGNCNNNFKINRIIQVLVFNY
ncbi:unnamed protein product [Rhizophagus irregularis]|uniref:Uncharacterized protein n=1 Tax=Rhizophagus irregularis TaxID=588596 RepID=A0A915YMJ7_9GLOM|nr:unnamed protein product [Rhizophagus irregularis]CAB5291460.1 unnamed protein product [Rhizophagus irregularis]